MEETVIIALHPKILLVVDIQELNATRNTHLLQYPLRVPVAFLGRRVEDGIAHALLQPQLTVVSLKYTVHIVIAQRRRVTHVRIERLDAIAVITVQTIGRTYPHHTVDVTPHA